MPIGDFDGDGNDDFLVGASSTNAYIFTHPIDPNRIQNIAKEADFKLEVPNPMEMVVGDFNGDGLSDLLSPSSNPVTVFYGTRTKNIERGFFDVRGGTGSKSYFAAVNFRTAAALRVT